MEKLYLVIHFYKNTEPALYLEKLENLANLVAPNDNRTSKIYEWDIEKLGMKEVEYTLTLKDK